MNLNQHFIGPRNIEMTFLKHSFVDDNNIVGRTHPT